MTSSSSEEQFSLFFERCRNSLLAQGYLLTGDRQEAQDLVQEALLRAWRDWRRVSNLDNPEAWTRRVLYNLAVGRWRRLNVRRLKDVSSLLPTEAPAPSIEQLDVVNALRSLPANQREALILTAFVGLSTAEVAKEMRRSEGTVRVWLSRARAGVAAALGGAAPSAQVGGETDDLA